MMEILKIDYDNSKISLGDRPLTGIYEIRLVVSLVSYITGDIINLDCTQNKSGMHKMQLNEEQQAIILKNFSGGCNA